MVRKFRSDVKTGEDGIDLAVSDQVACGRSEKMGPRGVVTREP